MKIYMFPTVPLSIISSYSLYTQQWCMSYRQLSSSRLSLLLESCLQTCMTYTIAVCTVNNSWWWTEELSETCRFSFQNKFEKLVLLVGFIIRIFHDARSHERHDARSHERKMTKIIVAFRNSSKAPKNGGNNDKCSCASANSVTCTAPFVTKLVRA
jgi:hypothetical protein